MPSALIFLGGYSVGRVLCGALLTGGFVSMLHEFGFPVNPGEVSLWEDFEHSF